MVWADAREGRMIAHGSCGMVKGRALVARRASVQVFWRGVRSNILVRKALCFILCVLSLLVLLSF